MTGRRAETIGYPRILRTTARQGSGATPAAGPVSGARLPGIVDGTDAVRRPRDLAVHPEGWCAAARELELERIRRAAAHELARRHPLRDEMEQVRHALGRRDDR